MPVDLVALAARVANGDRAAIGQALSFVEDRRVSSVPAIASLLRALPALRGGLRVGLTGPPGVGKSTLGAALACAFRTTRRRVGVLAVDPSSPRSGGALLGDRARIDPGQEDDDGLFIRSMASGGDLGGLARAAHSAVEVLSAAHEVVLIETVGVGQSETDVELVADITVLVLQPDSGDTLQFLKAGILEIPDLIVINKADLSRADVVRRELATVLEFACRTGAVQIPRVLMTCARSSEGVSALADALSSLHASLDASGETARRRRAGMIAWCGRSLARRVGEIGIDSLGGPKAVVDSVQRGIDEGMHGMQVVWELESAVAARCRGGLRA
jgi:LAO/AO transport system kinase